MVSFLGGWSANDLAKGTTSSGGSAQRDESLAPEDILGHSFKPLVDFVVCP